MVEVIGKQERVAITSTLLSGGAGMCCLVAMQRMRWMPGRIIRWRQFWTSWRESLVGGTPQNVQSSASTLRDKLVMMRMARRQMMVMKPMKRELKMAADGDEADE